MKIIEKIVNIETGEENLIEREETFNEKAERETFEKNVLLKQQELAIKTAAKADLLEKLGITENEAKLLLS